MTIGPDIDESAGVGSDCPRRGLFLDLESPKIEGTRNLRPTPRSGNRDRKTTREDRSGCGIAVYLLILLSWSCALCSCVQAF
jgi:hypothetical protein